MKTLLKLLILSLLTTGTALAAHKIKDVKYESLNSREGKVSILFNKSFEANPDLSIKDKTIQVALPETIVWPKIEKRATLLKNFDTTLMAYQFNKDLSRFRIILPYKLNSEQSKVFLKMKGKKLEIVFPKIGKKVAATGAKVGRKPAIKGAAVVSKTINKYDETYLERLLKEREETVGKAPIKVNQNDFAKAPQKVQEDKVKMALAGAEKNNTNTFSIWKYAGKFAAFLGLILLLFYGVVALMRKGVLKKGKLGFLNSTKLVEVLSTTYVGPKRNILVVQAHNQVFLVGSSENGLNLISELDDVSGLLKEGEKRIAGDNFDSNIAAETGNEKNFKLKEESLGSFLKEAPNAVSPAVAAANQTKDNVKLSDQIKNKVKGLKSLQ